jgi:hypothetical protein
MSLPLGLLSLIHVVGVSKSVIAEVFHRHYTCEWPVLILPPQLTDATNIGDAIALTPLMWSTGEILGYVHSSSRSR